MNYTKSQQKAIVKIIKESLADYPEYEPNQINEYQRIGVDILPDIFFDEKGYPVFTNEEMRKLDLSEICFDNQKIDGVDFSYTNIDGEALEDLESKTLRNFGSAKKYEVINLSGTNLEGVDLSETYFEYVFIEKANLKNTGANIFIQECLSSKTEHIDNLSLSINGSNLEGIDLSDDDFTGVDISGSNLTNTGATINLCTSKFSSLTILRGCHVYLSSILVEKPTEKVIDGADIIDDITDVKNSIISQISNQKRKVFTKN